DQEAPALREAEREEEEEGTRGTKEALEAFGPRTPEQRLDPSSRFEAAGGRLGPVQAGERFGGNALEGFRRRGPWLGRHCPLDIRLRPPASGGVAHEGALPLPQREDPVLLRRPADAALLLLRVPDGRRR